MPNWCTNRLLLSHSDASKLQEFRDAFASKNTCNHYLPMPDGYLESGQWYDWCIENWGTKWDFGSTVEMNCSNMPEDLLVDVSFSSAWSPPIKLYDKLCELGYGVRAYYVEEGVGFAGIYTDGHNSTADYCAPDPSDEGEA